MMNIDDSYMVALANRAAQSPVDVMRDGSEMIHIAQADDFTQMATEMAAGTEPEGAAPMSARQFLETAADVPAGLVKGAIQGTIGLPGDIESLTYGVRELINRKADESMLDAFVRGIETKTILPTTENVKQWLDTNVGPLVPAGADQRRVEAAKTAEFVGELGGAGQTIIEGTKAAARGAKAVGDIIVPNGPLTVQEPAASVSRSATLPKRQGGASSATDTSPIDGAGAVESIQFVELPDGQFATSTAFQETKKIAVGFDRASTADQAAHITAGLRKSPQEQLVALVLDEDDKPIQIIRHTIGLADQTSAEPFSLLGAIANTPGAKSFWLSHNHPSGNATLSNADTRLANALNRISENTGIKMRGILAIAKSKFAAYSPDGQLSVSDNDIPAAARKQSISMVERTFRKSNVLDSVKVSNPQEAKLVAQKIAGNDSGLVLFNAARQPVAFVPMNNADLENLRKTGIAKQLFGALEKANAKAAMYVTKLEPNMDGIANLQDMLQEVGSPMFDALGGVNRESLINRLPTRFADFKSIFPVTGAATGAAATMQDNEGQM